MPSDAKSSDAESNLLHGLRDGTAKERDAAFRELLAEHGVRFSVDDRGRVVLPAGGRVNEQPGSLVAQAAADLLSDLDRVLAPCRTDEDVRRLFSAIIKRRRIDSRRRKKNRGVGMGDGSRQMEPGAGAQRSVGSLMGDAELLRVHTEALLAAAEGFGDGRDAAGRALQRSLVSLYVVEQLDWPEVCERLQEPPTTLKPRFSRMRPHLAQAMYAGFLETLPPMSVAMARALFADGKSTADAAKEGDTTVEQVRRTVQSEILPKMREHFGPSFLALLIRVQRRPQAGPE